MTLHRFHQPEFQIFASDQGFCIADPLVVLDLPPGLLSEATGLKCKETGIYLNANVAEVHPRINAYGYLLTCNFTPEHPQMTCWSVADAYLDAVFSHIKTRSDFLYAVGTIEVHPPSVHRPKRKPKAKSKPKGKTAEDDDSGSGPLEELPDRDIVMTGSVAGAKPLLTARETPEEQALEVVRYFTNHDATHAPNIASTANIVWWRILTYAVLDTLAASFFTKCPVSPETVRKLTVLKPLIKSLVDPAFVPPFETINPYLPYLYGVMSSNYGLWATAPAKMSGYPHFHVAVFLNRPFMIEDIQRQVLGVGMIKDVDVKNHSTAKFKRSTNLPDPANDARIVGYVLKNCRSKIVYERLRHYPVRLFIGERYGKVITNLYAGLLAHVPLCRIHTLTPAESAPEYEQPPVYAAPFHSETRSEDSGSPLRSDSRYAIDKREVSGRCLFTVTAFLNERNLYVREYPQDHPYASVDHETEIYCKIAGSVSSYKYYCNVKQIFSRMVETQEHLEMVTRHTDLIKKMFDLKRCLPCVEPTTEWAECGDFFYYFETSAIVPKDEPHHTFLYFPEITMETIRQIKTKQLRTRLPTALLQYQGILDIDGEITTTRSAHIPEILQGGCTAPLFVDPSHVPVLSPGVPIPTLPTPIRSPSKSYYQATPAEFVEASYNTFRRRLRKRKCLSLVGPSNSGKTSFLELLSKIYPDHLIAQATFKSNFPYEKAIGAELVFTEEWERKDMRNPLTKLLLDGGSPVDINRKGLRSIRCPPGARMLISSNDKKWFYGEPKNHDDEADADPALLARIANYEFRSLEITDTQLQKEMHREASLFVFQLAFLHFGASAFPLITLEALKETLDDVKRDYNLTSL